MWGITPRANATTLRKLRSTALRHSSIEMDRKFLGGGPPAFATQISIRPNFSAAAATNFATPSVSVTSRGWAKTWTLCRLRISSAAAFSFFSVRAHMAMFAPSAAKASAVARPMRSLDPETMATLFLSANSMSSFRSRYLALLIALLVEDRNPRRCRHLDVVLLEAFFDGAPQLAAHGEVLPRSGLNQHQVNHFSA